MLSLFLAFLLIQPVSADKHWIPLSNVPGWEGYGTVLPSGWIDPEKFRRVGDPTVEVSPFGRQILPGQRPALRSESATENPGDFGFLGWLNSRRAAMGLSVVGWDANLANWAAQNSAVGFGHHVRAGRRQNAGMGSAAHVWTMWVASPAHAAALFDPTITRVGIAVVNGIWTMNAD